MYTNKTKVQNYLMTNIDSSFDDQIEYWATAAEKYINNYTNRKDGFEASTKTKYYDGNGESELLINSFTSLTTVQILDDNSSSVGWTLTEGIDNDYITYPANDTPKYKLKLTTNSSAGAFYSGSQRIKITGTFGYATTVPKDIELVATILVAEIVKQSRDGGLAISQGLGDYSTSFETFSDTALRITDVRNILNSYKLLKI